VRYVRLANLFYDVAWGLGNLGVGGLWFIEPYEPLTAPVLGRPLVYSYLNYQFYSWYKECQQYGNDVQ